MSTRSRAKKLLPSAFQLVLAVALLGFHCATFAAPPTNQVAIKAAQTSRAMKALAAARARFNSNTNNAEAAWQFGRACFDVADLAANDVSKADMANEGIAACRQSITLNSNSAPAHYYLGMLIGELADTKRNLSALRMVREMEREFLDTLNLDEHFDFGGANRNLGLLYAQAPSIGSIGSRIKARQHLQRAVDLAPDFPENRLNLIELDLKWNNRAGALHELKALEELWPQAQQKFSTAEWEASWPDWEKRLALAKKKLDETPKSLDPPKNAD